MATNISPDVRREFLEVIASAYRASADVGREVETILLEGRIHALSREDASRLLTRVVTALRERGGEAASSSLRGDIDQIVRHVLEVRDQMQARAVVARGTHLELVAHNGIDPRPVFPRPCFHGIDVTMNSGYVKTTDVKLWDANERLDIHIGQFQEKYGRPPTPEELLDIMLTRMKMPGVAEADQFKIVDLARSIAVNGVRKPPILDIDGTLLDGNRRVAACYYILNSDEFSSAEKQRIEYIFVWQMTEHATNDERNAVVVSLNFEPDCKEDWPEYVKARKVYEQWRAMLAVEPRLPGLPRQAEMKRELSKKFALGPDTSTVNRYLKMVEWADTFEEYHISEKRRDVYEVKHRANRYFQYFDELAKGSMPGGVAHSLNQDEAFRHIVFDLLFEGKFRNWRQIRELKLIFDNEEAREALSRARNENDQELAEEHLENAIAVARARSAEMREVGVNTRIESFTKWLEELPMRAFRDSIRPENLRRLQNALALVNRQVALSEQEPGGQA